MPDGAIVAVAAMTVSGTFTMLRGEFPEVAALLGHPYG